ncbi:hypothetical protein EJ08DRAFT_658936 [Tothia fuscella]|uniref:Uncharacterized protein n=1 Tax=Tothia fuscella TaxID=1048955 RepID=A0A9P4NVT3_9PEZI|nr:hypothetical protein EJ08DRAFT_658936 [Tothia fuscella]
MAFVTKPMAELPDDYRAPGKPTEDRLTELEIIRGKLAEARERREKVHRRMRLPKESRQFAYKKGLDKPGARYKFDDDKCYWVADCQDGQPLTTPRNNQKDLFDTKLLKNVSRLSSQALGASKNVDAAEAAERVTGMNYWIRLPKYLLLCGLSNFLA